MRVHPLAELSVIARGRGRHGAAARPVDGPARPHRRHVLPDGRAASGQPEDEEPPPGCSATSCSARRSPQQQAADGRAQHSMDEVLLLTTHGCCTCSATTTRSRTRRPRCSACSAASWRPARGRPAPPSTSSDPRAAPGICSPSCFILLRSTAGRRRGGDRPPCPRADVADRRARRAPRRSAAPIVARPDPLPERAAVRADHRSRPPRPSLVDPGCREHGSSSVWIAGSLAAAHHGWRRRSCWSASSPRTLGRQHAAGSRLTAPRFGCLAACWARSRAADPARQRAHPRQAAPRDGPFATEAELRELVDLAENGVHRGRRARNDPLGLRARRHPRARGHGAAHRPGVIERHKTSARRSRWPAQRASRRIPVIGDERGRRRRHRSTSRTSPRRVYDSP